MTEKVEVIAIITAKPDQGPALKEELIKLVEPSRAEDGCDHYELQEDKQNPERFFMIERWASHKVLEQHVESKHFQEFVSNSDTLIASLDPALVNTVI